MTDKPKRPRDANQLAKSVVDIATGEAEDCPAEPKTSGPQSLGGARRAVKLTSKQRSDIAKKAAIARWEKTGQNHSE